MKIPDLSLSALRTLYKSGAMVPADVVNSLYDRLESEPVHPVWITLFNRQQALKQVSDLPLDIDLPLYGIPFAVKDNIDVGGHPTTAACPAYSFVPEHDSFVVARLEAAGAILIGKTNMDQFATGLVGTRSPYGACSSVFNSSYISGGSSSGSAVAVAGGLVSFSLGTDTAGSGRVPAAFNNIVGLKPSRGLLSASGIVPACRSLDCVSIFALSPADATSVFHVARGVDDADPFSRALPEHLPVLPGGALRVGIPREDQLEFFGDKQYQRLFAEYVTRLRSHGHSIVEMDLAPFREAAELLYSGPYVAERFAAVGEFVKRHLDEVDPIVGPIVTASEKYTAADAYNALYKLNSIKKTTNLQWEYMDLLLLPTTPTTYSMKQIAAEPLLLNSRLGYYTNFVNLLDLCALAVPAGFTNAGLPFGVTFVGRTFADASLLKFCDQQNRGRILLGVVGAHLSGQPLNHQLTERGAWLVRTTRTTNDYRCYALINSQPPKPGLMRNPGFEGPGIEIEVWSIHESHFGSFVAAIPSPLGIGTCHLADGTSVKGFLCESYATEGMPEITPLGGWRKYLGLH